MSDASLPPARGLRTHWCGALRTTDAGTRVSLCGWVDRRREHGEHLAFVDLRDHTGVVQCVVDGAHDLRSEYVLRVTGTVRDRPEGTANPALATGDVDVGDCEVDVLNAAAPPPFPVADRVDAAGGEEARDITAELRRAGVACERAFDARSMKAQFRAADRSGARMALVVGDQERADGTVTVRDLEGGDQQTVDRADVVAHVRKRLA